MAMSWHLSATYPTKTEAEKHAKRFRKMKWGGKIRRKIGGWGVYYKA